MTATPAADQARLWGGAFGRAYTDRNTYDLDELEAFYRRQWGVSRTEMNTRVIGDLPRDSRILEVGANTGNQLLCLAAMGFTELYGIELQRYAVEGCQARLPGVNVIQGSAFDIPFKDGYFDLVFTSGLLIHVPPAELAPAMAEIHRCARRYIWGFEYYEDSFTEILYRGERAAMWKGPYARRYLDLFDDLRLVREAKFPYVAEPNVDAMFLLEKETR